MSENELLSQIAGFMDRFVYDSAPLAAIGAAAIIGVIGTILLVGLRLALRIAARSGRASNGAVKRAASLPGYRILVGDVDGRGGAALRKVLQNSLETHLDLFNFGALYRLFHVISLKGAPEGAVLRAARKRLEKTGADMFIWGTRRHDGEDGLLVHGVSRGGGLSAEQAEPFTIALPGRAEAYGEAERKALTYALAKALQPALARPESFRPERIREVADILDALLDSGLALDRTLRRSLERDFSAITLHLAESQPNWTLMEKLIVRRRATLNELKQEPNSRDLLQARLDLGQALLKMSEVRFDPVAVREATVALSAVVEVLRSHPVIREAQRASDGLAKAQSLVETRRRFAVNFNA